MNDVEELLQQVAEQAGAQARPPALATLRRRRARRSAARAGVVAAALAGVGAAVVLVPSGPGPARDVVVADAAPSHGASSSAVPVPPGQVALPAWAAQELRLPAGAPAVADVVFSYPTEDGPLVTAVRRDGDRLCWASFTAGAPDAPLGGAACNALTLPAYRSGRLDLGATSTGPSTGSSRGSIDWLVVTGSAPAGTRTVVLTTSGGTQERLSVTGAGPEHLDRAWFALPWVQEDTVVAALDAEGRTLAQQDVLLAMGQPAGS